MVYLQSFTDRLEWTDLGLNECNNPWRQPTTDKNPTFQPITVIECSFLKRLFSLSFKFCKLPPIQGGYVWCAITYTRVLLISDNNVCGVQRSCSSSDVFDKFWGQSSVWANYLYCFDVSFYKANNERDKHVFKVRREYFKSRLIYDCRHLRAPKIWGAWKNV